MSLYKQVEKLVRQGYGSVVISRELGIGRSKITKLIKQVREDYPDIPAASMSPCREKTNSNRKNSKNVPKIKTLEGKSLDEKVEILSNEGFGCRKIALALDVGETTVDSKLRKLRGAPVRRSKAQEIQDRLDAGEDIYQISKELNSTPNGVKQLIAKSNQTYDPTKKFVEKIASKGIRLSKLYEEFEITSKERALEILKENFPGHFIVETKVDKDILLMPVKDSSNKHEWLNLNQYNKKFKYYVNEDSNYMSVQFDDDLPGDTIRIFNITDIHIGSKAHRPEVLKQMLDLIKDNPNYFFVIGGDTIEAITKASVGDPAEQTLSLNEQVTEAVKIFYPIIDKCLGMSWGNHCGGRTEKTAQVDLAKIMSEMLGVPYFRVRATIDLTFRGEQKTISLAHKYGGAIKLPQVVAQVKSIVSQVAYPVHAFFSGHNHESFVVPLETISKVSGKGFEVVRYYVANGGSYVSYTGTYAEKEGYGRSPQDTVYFEFDDQGNYGAGSIPVGSV